MVHKTLHIKLNIEQQEYDWTSGFPEGRVVAAPLMPIIVLLCDKSCVKWWRKNVTIPVL